jgi:PAS domain S-box-containing protein
LAKCESANPPERARQKDRLTVKTYRDIILDSINEGVFTVDLDWRITSFNRAAARITGVPAEQALGSYCWDVFHANICESDCTLKRTMDSGKPSVRANTYIIHHSGRKVPIRISAAVLHDDQGQIIGGVETFQDLSQVEQLQKKLKSQYNFADMVGRSPAMRQVFSLLPRVAQTGSTVLIEGPSGSGKELVARAIHSLSPRRDKPLVIVNCAALPDTLLESELFGYKAGAFTDARRDKAGRFTRAHQGTIFLDEIGDISPALQVRLLRFLEDRVVEPLGANQPLPVDVRVVAATNKDLKALVENGLFREDLYYRIRVIHVKLPSLKERKSDLPLLIDHIINKLNHLQGRDIAGVSPEAMACLMAHDYPGNVRELENILEQGLVLCPGRIIELHHLPPELRPQAQAGLDELGSANLKAMEKVLILHALERHKGNRKSAARDLGIDVSTLYRKIKRLGLEVAEQRQSGVI